MAALTFDDIYNRKTDPGVISEIERRKKIYARGIAGSDAALSEEEYRWLYRKTAYLTLKNLQSYEATVIYDINFGKPKLDILYNSDPAGSSTSATGYRDVKPNLGRDVEITEAKINEPMGYSTLLGPITAPLLDLYTAEKGFIATTLVEASIETYGDYGLAFTEKFSVKFIVHDRDKVSFYLENIMRPLTAIELGFGWTTEDNDPNRGFIRGTVTNFSFSANQDGSWNCMIEGYSNPQLAAGVPLSSITVTSNLTSVLGGRNDFVPVYADNTYVKTPSESEIDFNIRSLLSINGGLGGILSKLIDNSQLVFDKGTPIGGGLVIPGSSVMSGQYIESKFNPSNISTLTGYYIINMPIGQFLTPIGISKQLSDFLMATENQVVPRAYIRLDALIHIMNCILAYNLKLQKDTPMRIIIDKNISLFTGANPVIIKTGPADFLKFTFPGANIGQGVANFPLAEDFLDNVSNNQYYLGAILLNAEYVFAEFKAATSNYKGEENRVVQSFQIFLNNLFKQLGIEMGGMINAACISTDTEIIIKDVNAMQAAPPQGPSIVELPAFTPNSVCREASIESDVSNEILTVAAVVSDTDTSIGRSKSSNTILTENGVIITLDMWNSYNETEKRRIQEKSATLKIDVETVLKNQYAQNPNTILDLIKNYNEFYNGIAGITNQKFPSNQEKNQNGQFLNDFLNEPFPTSHSGYVMKIQEYYRFIFQGSRQAVLEGNNSRWNTIFNLRTATFPIRLKIKLDGIHGFKFGNYITTNWLPGGYSSKNCYFQITKVSHTIANNDWYTELETIYRIILPTN
jgi:hypothetical protein